MEWLPFLKRSGVVSKEGFFTGIFSPKKEIHKVTVCDLGRTKILLLEMEKKSDHVFIHRFDILKHASLDHKPAFVLKPFFDGKKYQKNDIRTALKGHGVVIRFIRFPKMKIEELNSVMKYEAEQYIPFELDDVVLDFAVVEESVKTDEGEKMEVLLAVVKRKELEPTLEIFRNLECQLSLVDVDILSGMAALEYFHPEDFSGHQGLFDLGTEISTLGIVRDGKPRFIRDISYGTYDLQKRLKTRSNWNDDKVEQFFEKNAQVTHEEAQVITESLAGLIGDLRLSFDYYRDQVPQTKPIDKLYLSGGISHPLVQEVLSAGLQMPVCSVDMIKKLKWAPEVDETLLKMNLPRLPVVLGLGIREE